MSAALALIIVMPMPTALIQMETSRVLANQVFKALEQLVLVSKVSVNELFN